MGYTGPSNAILEHSIGSHLALNRKDLDLPVKGVQGCRAVVSYMSMKRPRCLVVVPGKDSQEHC